MTRLIDVDVLKAMLAEDEITFPMLDDVPTVDAIPVEFIKEEIRKTRGFYNSNLRFLLDVWEQEKGERKEE